MSQLGALFSGLWGDAGASFVDEQGGPDAVFGVKPQVADYTPVDLAAEQGKAVGANIGAMSEIDKLLESILPGYRDMLAQGSKNTLSMLKGEIPQDVADHVMRTSAYQSLIGGFAGSGMSKALTARDFGLTSLDLMGKGENSAQAWSRLATGNAAPFMITPGQQAATTTENNRAAQAIQQFKFNVAAAPDPGAAGIFNIDAALGSQMLGLGMGAIGGIGGGGGGSKAPVANSTSWGNANWGNWGTNG